MKNKSKFIILYFVLIVLSLKLKKSHILLWKREREAISFSQWAHVWFFGAVPNLVALGFHSKMFFICYCYLNEGTTTKPNKKKPFSISGCCVKDSKKDFDSNLWRETRTKFNWKRWRHSFNKLKRKSENPVQREIQSSFAFPVRVISLRWERSPSERKDKKRNERKSAFGAERSRVKESSFDILLFLETLQTLE